MSLDQHIEKHLTRAVRDDQGVQRVSFSLGAEAVPQGVDLRNFVRRTWFDLCPNVNMPWQLLMVHPRKETMVLTFRKVSIHDM